MAKFRVCVQEIRYYDRVIEADSMEDAEEKYQECVDDFDPNDPEWVLGDGGDVEGQYDSIFEIEEEEVA